MTSSIIVILGNIIMYALDLWIGKSKKDKEMIDSYYKFLEAVDKAGAAKVANYMSSEDALKAKQEELKNELKKASDETTKSI